MHMSVSPLDTLHSSGSDSFWYALDKGKSPLLDTSLPVHRHDSLGFNVSDFQSVRFYHVAPLYMNSTITNIQEILDCPSSNQPAKFTDFLSSCNTPPDPFSSGPSPKPFQLRGQTEPIYLPPDPNWSTNSMGLPSHISYPLHSTSGQWALFPPRLPIFNQPTIPKTFTDLILLSSVDPPTD
jgi:hypothetical protein